MVKQARVGAIDSNKSGARKFILPHFEITQTTSETDPEATPVTILHNGQQYGKRYFVRSKFPAVPSRRKDGLPDWGRHRYNHFPIVLEKDGTPWAEAVLYILSKVEDKVAPTMSSNFGTAEDLAAYRRFLDDYEIDWMCFHSNKLLRPTYRFNYHLMEAVRLGEIAASSAKRRMGAIIGFYRWLKNEGAFIPENPAWKETDVYINIRDSKGFDREKKVVTTDISIKVPKQKNPYDGTISDGGKLCPLPLEKQAWVIDALVSLGNTEMTLIHLTAFLTGARIQTVLTMQVRHVLKDPVGDHQGEVRLPIGLGTGIDVKNNKQMVLHFPLWLYERLQTYSQSERARKRREKAKGGDNEEQYLFLSVRGLPHYQSREELRFSYADNDSRHVKVGQGVRQFITERIIPFVREKYAVPEFRYKFHDTRATAGMNWTEDQLELVAQGKVTLSSAREYVKIRMGHESSATTDLYLNYKTHIAQVREVNKGYESRIQGLIDRATKGRL